MNDIAIRVENLSKIYKLYDKPIDRMKESLHPLKKKYHKDFYALDDVSFEVKKGETVGIIGKNGAGKSTLLKIITGVLTPTSGEVQVNGRISSLLELGAGFNPEYTGIENIFFQGTLIGYSEDEMQARLDDITSFADIGDFIHQPVKMYSSGMFARLAFAVAINVDPDILIVDEALSVGDMRFQAKCFRKFKDFQDDNKTILFVTHDTGAIINYCSKAFWIHSGKKHEEGTPNYICKRYASFMAYDQVTKKKLIPQNETKNNKQADIKWISTSGLDCFGEGGARITHVCLIEYGSINKETFSGGEKVFLKLKIHSISAIKNLIVGFIAYDYLGNSIFGSNTHVHECVNCNKIHFMDNKEYIVTFSFLLPHLKNGEYSISPAIAEGTQDDHIQHHWVHNALKFKIHSLNDEARMGWMLTDKNIKVEIKNG